MRGKVLGLTYHISSLYNTNKFLDSKSPVICGSRAGLFAVWDIHMQTASSLIATTSSVDFTVDKTTGEAYISQTKLAELCGVTQHAISQHVSKTRDTLKLNDINQIHEDSVELVMSHYAFESQRPNETALKNYRVLAKAGIRAYIYHMAGYVMEAKPAVPQTYLEALKALVVSEEARLLEVAAHERTQTLLEEKRLQLDESREYLSIKRVAAFNGIPWKDLSWRTLKGTGLPFRKIFDANYGEVNAYHHTAWEQVYPELELPM